MIPDPKYITREGDTAELIAWRYYKTQGARVVEQLLDANPRLADYGPVIPGGITVVLPVIDTTEKTAGTKLWD